MSRGEPCDRQRVCQTRQLTTTPRVSTPGLGHFYAPFRDCSHPSAAYLGLSIARERAAKDGAKGLCSLDTLPPFDPKFSFSLPRRGDNQMEPDGTKWNCLRRLALPFSVNKGLIPAPRQQATAPTLATTSTDAATAKTLPLAIWSARHPVVISDWLRRRGSVRLLLPVGSRRYAAATAAGVPDAGCPVCHVRHGQLLLRRATALPVSRPSHPVARRVVQREEAPREGFVGERVTKSARQRRYPRTCPGRPSGSGYLLPLRRSP